jgi:hypothetical protein
MNARCDARTGRDYYYLGPEELKNVVAPCKCDRRNKLFWNILKLLMRDNVKFFNLF